MFDFEDSPFEISSNFYIPRGTIDVVTLFTVGLNEHPVLLIELSQPALFALESKREQADQRMRDRLHRLQNNSVTPRVHGISAFGTRMAFYEYAATANKLNRAIPGSISSDPRILNNLAPVERWYDILEDTGVTQLCQVVEDVKGMCENLND